MEMRFAGCLLVVFVLFQLGQAIPSGSSHGLGSLRLDGKLNEDRPKQGSLRRAAELGGGVKDLKNRDSDFLPGDHATAQPCGLAGLRGGASLTKKLGGKNVGLLVILLSLLYLPRAMGSCSARLIPGTKARKATIQRLGCGAGLAVTNVMTLAGLAMVLVNSRQFDRHGRSKLKMRLTGSVIICIGMMIVIAHAEPASVSWYSKANAYLGVMFEWWGFISLFYNFTPKFVAQLPRELNKLFGKVTGKTGQSSQDYRSSEAAKARDREVDRLNRWAQAQSGS